MTFDRARRTPAGVAGRAALVTGGASGIGLAIAERLAAEGARVTLVDLPGQALDEAAGQIGGATALPCDLAARWSPAPASST